MGQVHRSQVRQSLYLEQRRLTQALTRAAREHGVHAEISLSELASLGGPAPMVVGHMAALMRRRGVADWRVPLREGFEAAFDREAATFTIHHRSS